MDGIDAGLIETDAKWQIKEHGGTAIHYEPEFKILLKAAELAVKKSTGNLKLAAQIFSQCISDYLDYAQIATSHNFNHINFNQVIEQSTELHHAAIKKLLADFSLSAKDITAIGYHGQTLFHLPQQLTIQVGDGQLLANLTNIQVINNFREQDVKLGGQGAPLAPIYHQVLAMGEHDAKSAFNNLAVVNCGGIANVTFISGPTEQDIIGFDTGPGNNLLDRLVTQKTNGSERMDTNGNYGMQGQVNQSILEQLFNQAIPLPSKKNYFQLEPPKSLDANDLNLIKSVEKLSLPDGCATLAAFTAQSIVNGVDYLLDVKKLPTTWILAGGGWHNQKILSELKFRLQDKLTIINPRLAAKLNILTANEFGWDSQYMEAYIFGYLAARRLQNYPTSLPSITGVKQSVSAGNIYLPKNN
jgi:anhydro-N-acetylmuramic acid kinase